MLLTYDYDDDFIINVYKLNKSSTTTSIDLKQRMLPGWKLCALGPRVSLKHHAQ